MLPKDYTKMILNYVFLCIIVFLGGFFLLAASKLIPLSKSEIVSIVSMLFLVAIVYLLNRRPSIAEKSSAFSTVIIIFGCFSLFSFLSNEILVFLNEHSIRWDKDGIEVMRVELKEIKKIASESRALEANLNEIKGKNDFSSYLLRALADNREALNELVIISKDPKSIFRNEAAFHVENIKRTDYGFQYLGTNTEWKEYFPDLNPASTTFQTLIDRFSEKCKFKDQIMEFFDLLRNNPSIPEKEIRHFYFEIIKGGKSIIAYNLARYAIPRGGHEWPTRFKFNEENLGDFEKWWEEHKKFY